MIRALEINLASRPFRNNVPIWVAHALLAAVLVGFTAWNIRTWLDATARLKALQDAAGSTEKHLADLERRDAAADKIVRDFDVKVLKAQATEVNEIILRRGLSWTQLFNTMEKIVPYEVRMTAIRPVYGTREAASAARRSSVAEGTVPVDVEGVAQSLEAFLELERALIVDPHFVGVEPVRSDSSPGNPEVRFQLHFLYDPAGTVGQEHPAIPHVLDAARKAAEEGGEAPASALEGLR